MGKPAELYYHGVDLPGRGSVREPMPPPVIRLVRGDKLVQVKMNEAQLLDLILNATRTLDLMRKSRGATVPNSGPLETWGVVLPAGAVRRVVPSSARIEAVVRARGMDAASIAFRCSRSHFLDQGTSIVVGNALEYLDTVPEGTALIRGLDPSTTIGGLHGWVPLSEWAE
jgi:hypothetical protein